MPPKKSKPTRRKFPPFVAMKSFEFTSSYSLIDCARILEKEFKSSGGLFAAYKLHLTSALDGVCYFRIIEGSSIEIEGSLKPSRGSSTLISGTVGPIVGSVMWFWVYVTILYYIVLLIALVTIWHWDLPSILVGCALLTFPVLQWLRHEAGLHIRENRFIRLLKQTLNC